MLKPLAIALVIVLSGDLFAQKPTDVPKPTPSVTPAPKAEPLPELLRLKVENLQKDATIAGNELEKSDAYKKYQAVMAELGKRMDVVLSEAKKQCKDIDQLKLTWTPITLCQAGK